MRIVAEHVQARAGRREQHRLARAGRRSIQIAADVTQSAALNDAVARTEAELGALSLAVNAAGIANANPAEEVEESQFQTMMDINLKGPMFAAREALRPMRAQGWGRVISISSLAGRNGGVSIGHAPSVPRQAALLPRTPHPHGAGHAGGA